MISFLDFEWGDLFLMLISVICPEASGLIFLSLRLDSFKFKISCFWDLADWSSQGVRAATTASSWDSSCYSFYVIFGSFLIDSKVFESGGGLSNFLLFDLDLDFDFSLNGTTHSFLYLIGGLIFALLFRLWFWLLLLSMDSDIKFLVSYCFILYFWSRCSRISCGFGPVIFFLRPTIIWACYRWMIFSCCLKALPLWNEVVLVKLKGCSHAVTYESSIWRRPSLRVFSSVCGLS